MMETERLILRRWREEDRDGLCALMGDARVLEFVDQKPFSRDESDKFFDRIQSHFAEHGFGIFAVEHRATKKFMGFTGLWTPRFEAHFTPCVEIGWRLLPEYWGKGYASEAAKESLRFGFEDLGLKEIVSFAAVNHMKSRAIMERIGMTRDMNGDFDHPNVKEVSLKRQVLYRLKAGDFIS